MDERPVHIFARGPGAYAGGEDEEIATVAEFLVELQRAEDAVGHFALLP